MSTVSVLVEPTVPGKIFCGDIGTSERRVLLMILNYAGVQDGHLHTPTGPLRIVCADLLDSPTVYDAFLRLLARRGHAVPESILTRDVREAWVEQPDLVPVLAAIYEDTSTYWEEYAVCEDLVDLEDVFQLWRFRHLRTVQRTIGFKRGTGGSSGVGFLQRALELTFFPELYTVRTHLGA